MTQAFGLKGAAALRGRPPGPRSCACTLPRWPRTDVLTGAGRARTAARASTALPPPAAVACESPSGRRCPAVPGGGGGGGGGGSRLSRVALASRRRQGLAARCGRRGSRRRPPQAGSALGEARHDGADMAPLKPSSLRAPRAGRALSEPGEVTWLHTFDCFWSPSPEGGPGQVRSHVRVTGLRGLASGASRVWGRGPGGGAEQPARGRRRGACSASAAASAFLTRRPGGTHSCGLEGVAQRFSASKARCPPSGVCRGCRGVRAASSSDLGFGGAVTGRRAG